MVCLCPRSSVRRLGPGVDNRQRSAGAACRRTVDTLAGVLTGLWPGAAASGADIPAATSAAIDEVLWGNADSCARLRSMFKRYAERVRGALLGLCLFGLGWRIMQQTPAQKGHGHIRKHFLLLPVLDMAHWTSFKTRL